MISTDNLIWLPINGRYQSISDTHSAAVFIAIPQNLSLGGWHRRMRLLHSEKEALLEEMGQLKPHPQPPSSHDGPSNQGKLDDQPWIFGGNFDVSKLFADSRLYIYLHTHYYMSWVILYQKVSKRYMRMCENLDPYPFICIYRGYLYIYIYVDI